jgi:hypothetical protein
MDIILIDKKKTCTGKHPNYLGRDYFDTKVSINGLISIHQSLTDPNQEIKCTEVQMTDDPEASSRYDDIIYLGKVGKFIRYEITHVG